MLELLDTQALKVLHAAMVALYLDVHTCQDALTDSDWRKAKDLWEALDAEFNLRTAKD